MFELIDVCKTYGEKRNLLHALSNINLIIDDGQTVSIMGKSGSGKSTLLNLISTVDKATSGKIIYNGNEIQSISEKKAASLRINEFGFIYQSFHLIPSLNVYDNICMPSVFSKKKTDYDYVQELSRDLGIDEYFKKKPAFLSGGEQQRVAIARALANKPKVLFADEPTGNLDSENGRKVIEILLDSTKKNNQTLIYVTHDEELAQMAERKIIISDGHLQEENN